MISSVAFAQTPTNGLQSYYSFDAGSSIDDSGKNNDGIGVNVTYTTDRFANSNGAASFLANGSMSSYISLPDSIFSKNTVTLSFWFKTDKVGQPLITYQRSSIGSTSINYVPIAYILPDSTLSIGYATGSSANRFLNAAAKVADNQWHHLVVSISTLGQTAYLDNVFFGSDTRQHVNANNHAYCTIGGGYVTNWPGLGAGTQYFTGQMDDIRVYHSELNASHVNLLFTQNILPLIKQSIVDYSFNSANARDTSGFQNHGTPNSVTYGPDRFNNTNFAALFSATSTPPSSISFPDSIFSKDELTLSAWFKTDKTGQVLFSYQSAAIGSNSTYYVPIAYIRNDSTLSTGFWEGGSNLRYTNSAIKVADNNWHHLSIAIDGSGQTVYLDNQLFGNDTRPHSGITRHPFCTIGAGFVTNYPDIAVGTQYFTGSIDDVKIYDFKLDSASVAQLFNEANPNIAVGLQTNNSNLNNLTIYPNPSTGIFNISTMENVQAIEVYGMNGQQIEGISIRENEINLTDYPNGIYFVRVITENGLITKKLIKN